MIAWGSPLYVMLKPAGGRCNLRCRYCYYIDKDDDGALSEPLLETFTRQYLEAQTQPEVLFTWHGGEPLLRPLAFYRRALALQRQYGRGRQVDNCLQTNGVLLNDEWCMFLREHNFLVGISIDGPEDLHDHYRRTRGGGATWRQVMRGIELLEKHGVMWNAMATVNRYNAGHPQRFYRFFRDMGCQFLQFTPVVERESLTADGRQTAVTDGGRVADYSVRPQQWGDFLCSVYDEWVRRDVGHLFVQLFDATLANWAGEPPGVCSMAPTCGHAAVMEHNGDVYSCDHFVWPAHRLGNIGEEPLTALLYGEQQQRFGASKLTTLTRECRECRWLFACHGECPRNRFVSDRYGQAGHNYLCAGYRRYFAHVAADMDYMKAELDAGRAPANVMDIKSSLHHNSQSLGEEKRVEERTREFSEE